MIQQEEALARILGAVRPLPSRALGIVEAMGRFAARDYFARVALPPFDNSAMDGYAVLASSCAPGTFLRIVGEQPAGLDRGLAVGAGEAIRILTGGPMPAGADAVVMQEDTTVVGGRLIVNTTVSPGEFVRRSGGDVAIGQRILAAGQRIRPATVALLASQGIAAVEVGGGVRVSILSTGDELVPAGVEPRPGQIYDSNGPLLQALVQRSGVASSSAHTCVDDEAATQAAVQVGIKSEVLIITGGVSVGARDFVKSAIRAVGGEIDVWRVSVKPGKPFLFGRAGTCAIFGVPGNPVSAFVTFLLFVRPAILRLAAAADSELGLARVPASINEEIANPGDRPHYVRGALSGGTFKPIGKQESHAVFGLSRADALLLVPPGATIVRGEVAEALVFD